MYQRKVNNKMKGAYGMIDLDKHVISINKKRHKSVGTHAPGVKKNKDGTANLLDTIHHEELHRKHPQLTEKMIKKLTIRQLDKMHPKQKAKLYGKYR